MLPTLIIATALGNVLPTLDGCNSNALEADNIEFAKGMLVGFIDLEKKRLRQ